jgi:hypothetical protein
MLRLRRAATSATKASAMRRFVQAFDLSVQGDECDHRHRNSLRPAMVTQKGYPVANRRASGAP